MKRKMNFISVCPPYLRAKEKEYLLQAINSSWISSQGVFIDEFETKFARFCGVKYGVSCSNGTNALHLACKAINLQPGDEVIMPDFTMVATLFSVLYCQAKPVFVDAEADTWNIDVNKIKAKINKKTKAILLVHIYGHPVDVAPVLKLVRKYKLWLIEDAAEAHGAEYNGKKCGSFGHLACFSFYANKIITCGEGGMVVASNKKLADKCRYYKNLCFPLLGKRSYLHNDLGYNFRMTNMQAAVGVAQLERIKSLINRRRKNARFYNKLLKDIPGIQLPVEKKYAKNVYWMYGIVVNSQKFGINRDKLMIELKRKGIDTRVFFQPMHRQPVLKKLGFIDKAKYPVSDYLAKNGLYLPSGSGLEEREIKYIAQTIRDINKKAQR